MEVPDDCRLCEKLYRQSLLRLLVLPWQFILQAEGLQLGSAQVLEYLRSRERWGDLRKYFGLADELLFLHSSGLPFPAWSGTPRTLKVI